MTKEEFMAKYGDIEVKFSSYYKFSFVFSGVLDNGNKISVEVGGNSDDIYRLEVVANLPETIASLNPNSGTVWYDGEIVESFYDYY